MSDDWLEVNGVKYIDCEWDSDDESKSPVNSPRKMQQLATALQEAVKKEEVTNTPPQHQSSTETPKPQPSPAAPSAAPPPVRRRRVHGGL